MNVKSQHNMSGSRIMPQWRCIFVCLTFLVTINCHNHFPLRSVNITETETLQFEELHQVKPRSVDVKNEPEESPKWNNTGDSSAEDAVLVDPPRNLNLQLRNEDEGSNLIMRLSWKAPLSSKSQDSTQTGYMVKVEQETEESSDEGPLSPSIRFRMLGGMGRNGYTDDDMRDFLFSGQPVSSTFVLNPDETSFTTSPETLSLMPGGSYSVSVQSMYHSHLSSPMGKNFTIKPNPPDRFVVWYRNETSFLILWQPPLYGYFQRYKAEISPSDPLSESPSVIYVTPWEYQFGGVRPGFFNLTPGKGYNISVVTESKGGVESEAVVREYRTMPLPPTNVTAQVVSYSNGPTVIVEWMPPQDEGEYDGFNVYIKKDWGRPVQKFISKTKPSRVHLDDVSGLEDGQTYQVVVKTVSGKVSSQSASSDFTFHTDL